MSESIETKRPNSSPETLIISDCDREVLLAIGRIKWQKQRPTVDRIFNICHKIRDKFTEFMTKDGVESRVNHMIRRQLLEKFVNANGCVVYRELGLAKNIVSITNLKRSRVKPIKQLVGEDIPRVSFHFDITHSYQKSEKLSLMEELNRSRSCPKAFERSIAEKVRNTAIRSDLKVEKLLIKRKIDEIKRTRNKIKVSKKLKPISSIDSIVESIERVVSSAASQSSTQPLSAAEEREESPSKRLPLFGKKNTFNKLLSTHSSQDLDSKTTNNLKIETQNQFKEFKKSAAQLKSEKRIKNAIKAEVMRKKRAELKAKVMLKKAKNAFLMKMKADLELKQETSSQTSPQSLPKLVSLQKLRALSKQEPKCRKCGIAGDESQSNQLITCSLCGMSGHSQCLGCSPTLLNRIKQFPYWECIDCKKCPICKSHDEQLFVCGDCDRGFHLKCIQTSDIYSSMIWVDCKKCNPILNNSLETKSTNTPLTSIDISPIDEFDNRKLESILKRANIRLPEKLNDKSYRKRLIKIIKRESPQISCIGEPLFD